MKQRYQPLLALLFSLLFSCLSNAEKVDVHILVEDSYFPVVVDPKTEQGLGGEFTALLNKYQHDFNFILDALPTKRFRKRVNKKEFDAVFLMAPTWLPKTVQPHLEKSSLTVTVTSRFYALKENALDQSYFDNFDNLTKIGVLGYSYKFADFNNDENYLKNKHNMTLTTSEMNVAKMILLKRAEIGIMNSLAYQYLIKINYLDIDLIYKSTTPDGVYDTTFLFNQQKNNITADKFDHILQSPVVKEKIQHLFSKYGLISSVSHW